MYVVDITRDNNITDILCGKDSMETKYKTINYIIDYVFANYNIVINRDTLDQKLNMDTFSLNDFLKVNYNTCMDDDFIIQSMPLDKQHCLFIKFIDDQSFPKLFSFKKNEMKYAKNVMRFLVNDTLINKLQDNLAEYEKIKIRNSSTILDVKYPHLGIRCQIVSLYNKGIFLEELLNSNYSLNQLQNNNCLGYEI